LHAPKAIAVLAFGSLVTLMAPAWPPASSPSRPVRLSLRANVPPDPNFVAVCQNHPTRGRLCFAATLAAIDHARHLEGVRPLVLPRNFLRDTPADQLFVVVNLERVDRGLPPVPVLLAPLNRDARSAALANRDPVWTAARRYDNVGYAWFSNWAQGLDPDGRLTAANVLTMDYGWMYYDGYAGPNAPIRNELCAAPRAPGCWGHRENILADDPAVGSDFALGAAYTWRPGSLPSGAMLLVETPVPLPERHPVYTWAAALAAGADGAPSAAITFRDRSAHLPSQSSITR
jgi:hypothetical protein